MIYTDHKIVEAKLFFKWFLTKFNYGAITTPWRTIYVRKDKMGDEGLINHELVHISQIEKYGPVVWTIKYLYYNFKYGYYNNPFEVEARLISGRQ